MLSWEIEIRFMTPPLPFKERLSSPGYNVVVEMHQILLN